MSAIVPHSFVIRDMSGKCVDLKWLSRALTMTAGKSRGVEFVRFFVTHAALYEPSLLHGSCENEEELHGELLSFA